MNYKNLTINETTTYQDVVYPSVYLKLVDVVIKSFNEKKAEVLFQLYKSKAISETNPDWQISVNEIQNIIMQFEIGDLIIPETVAGGVKQALMRINPTWKEENIIIEK